jgi:hypothetical protein
MASRALIARLPFTNRVFADGSDPGAPPGGTKAASAWTGGSVTHLTAGHSRAAIPRRAHGSICAFATLTADDAFPAPYRSGRPRSA